MEEFKRPVITELEEIRQEKRHLEKVHNVMNKLSWCEYVNLSIDSSGERLDNAWAMHYLCYYHLHTEELLSAQVRRQSHLGHLEVMPYLLSS